MEIYVDKLFTNGLIAEGTGTVATSPEGLATFTGQVSRLRWFKLNPGDTVVATVEMKGDINVQLKCYTYTGTTSTQVAYVSPDSTSELKSYSLSYTLPSNSTAKLVGIAYYTGANGYFYNPKITVENQSPPSLIACGLIDMVNRTVNNNFPNYGIKSVSLVTTNKVQVVLKQAFISSATRPLVLAVDGTTSGTPNKEKFVCSDIALVNGEVQFYIYYVGSDGTIIPAPTNASIQVVVYY